MTVVDQTKAARRNNLANLAQELRNSKSPSESLAAIRNAIWDVHDKNTSIMISTRGLEPGEYRVIQFHVHGAEPVVDHDPWGNDDLPVQRGGTVGQIIANKDARILNAIDWSGDAMFRDHLREYDKGMAIPILSDSLPVTWAIILTRSPEAFTIFDLEQAVLRMALISSLLESQSLAQKVAEAHAIIDRDVKKVGEIQRTLLPDPLPKIQGLEIATSFETFGQAGGDLYDFVKLPAGAGGIDRWAIFMGDASGHGPSAAVVIAIVQALLHAHPAKVEGPADLLKHLNCHLCRKSIESSFVTAFVAVVEPAARRVVYSRAGHPPAILRGAGGELRRLGIDGGYPLGIDADQEFPQEELHLLPGDTVLIYTDGIEEARDGEDEMFGIEGIEKVMAEGKARRPAEVIAAVQNAVRAHVKGRMAMDDQTLVAVSVV